MGISERQKGRHCRGVYVTGCRLYQLLTTPASSSFYAAVATLLLFFVVPKTWKLGILRNIGTLIGNLIEALAREGNLPYGTGENTLIAVNERLLHMTRRCRANLQPPG